MNRKWYVIRSKQHKEMALWRELTARGVECFYPQLQVQPVNPRSRKIRPYFPGYLFTYVDLQEMGSNALQWIPFSSGFVSFDNLPATVPDSMIDAIRQHVEQLNSAGGEQMAGLEQGDLIAIQGGAFDGYMAIFDERLPGHERVRVFLKLLEARQVSIELPAAQIRRMPPKRH